MPPASIFEKLDLNNLLPSRHPCRGRKPFSTSRSASVAFSVPEHNVTQALLDTRECERRYSRSHSQMSQAKINELHRFPFRVPSTNPELTPRTTSVSPRRSSSSVGGGTERAYSRESSRAPPSTTDRGTTVESAPASARASSAHPHEDVSLHQAGDRSATSRVGRSTSSTPRGPITSTTSQVGEEQQQHARVQQRPVVPPVCLARVVTAKTANTASGIAARPSVEELVRHRVEHALAVRLQSAAVAAGCDTCRTTSSFRSSAATPTPGGGKLQQPSETPVMHRARHAPLVVEAYYTPGRKTRVEQLPWVAAATASTSSASMNDASTTGAQPPTDVSSSTFDFTSSRLDTEAEMLLAATGVATISEDTIPSLQRVVGETIELLNGLPDERFEHFGEHLPARERSILLGAISSLLGIRSNSMTSLAPFLKVLVPSFIVGHVDQARQEECQARLFADTLLAPPSSIAAPAKADGAGVDHPQQHLSGSGEGALQQLATQLLAQPEGSDSFLTGVLLRWTIAFLLLCRLNGKS